MTQPIAHPVNHVDQSTNSSMNASDLLSTGAWFTKYHKVGSFLSNHARRFLFVQSNKFFFVRHPNERPAIGGEQRVEAKHQCMMNEIVNVTSGKTAGTFLSKAAQSSVKDENAFSIWIRREQPLSQTGSQQAVNSATGENIDFEAVSQAERDQWVNALRASVGQSANTSAAHSTAQSNEKLVEVKVDVDQNGEVKVVTTPVQPAERSVVTMPLDAMKQERGDDSPVIVDTPTNQTVDKQAVNQMIDHSVHTTTIRLDDQTSRITELESENRMLQERIAHLEQRLKESNVAAPSS